MPLPPVPRVVALGPCAQCGLVHEHCKAHRSTAQTDGDPNVPCGLNATNGRLVCHKHGGASRQAIAKGQERVARERALGEVGKLLAECYDEVEGMTGIEHLETGINRAAAMALAYESLFAELDDLAQAAPYEEGLRFWTRLHGELVKNALALGIEERKATVAAEQVDRIGGAIVALVAGLGRDLDDPAVVPVVENALRAIAGGEG